MDSHQLLAVETEIRSVISDSSLAWLLDDVDDAIAAGIPQEKVLRRRRGAVQQSEDADVALYQVFDPEAISSKEYETSRKQGTLVITTRPMTDAERVEVLLEALRRVLVELPDIELETLRILQEVPRNEEGARRVAETVTFRPEDEVRPRNRTAIALRRDHAAQRHQLSELFAQAAQEVAE
ncbi:hypothetical protein [Nocardia africana]|uniref:Uncharacterized protein n=1 Tax=Nocardia africana TaxID=134964 RepID=A0A378WQF3_9NOCA|nr:hypothetical protein [Nocardia africana]MCC3314882.1 hypothetical protein [Nocardia africana]SUA42835.1 Uncharacterised protein [Nocardia africana]